MNEWMRKNTPSFYKMTDALERHHLRGGYGGDLDLSQVYKMLSELFREVDSTQKSYEMTQDKLKTANETVKKLQEYIVKIGGKVADAG